MKKAVALVLFILFAAFVYRSSVFRISKNFGVVDDGRLYRSAQLNEKELVEIVKKYHIKTVVSLRGSTGRTFFYEPEAETLAKLGVRFESIGMSDDWYPHQDEVKKLAQIYLHADGPILIHCRVGADRTGMAAALYDRIIKKESIEESMGELSFRYWHVRAFHPAMSDFIRHTKDLDWVMNDYDVCAPEYAKYRKPDYVCQ